jgi:hypothetical protein
MNRIKLLGMLLIIALVSGCTNEADPLANQSHFTRIYDNDRFNASYDPLDIIQTEDGGYLVLGTRRLDESNFKGIYLLRTDAFGAFLSESEPDVDLVNPVGPILTLQGSHYFFAMTSVGLQSQLVALNEDGTIGEAVGAGGSYPAAAAVDGNNLLLLNYDIDNKASVLSLMSTTGAVMASKAFPIGAGDAVEEPIINHFLRTGRRLPFQVGKTASGMYFFNGFYNYTLSVVFTDLAADDPIGVVQGQQDDGGVSRIQETATGQFAMSRFNFGDNYLLPSTAVQQNGISSSADLGGFPLPELTDNTPVVILQVTVGDKDVLIFGANTKGKQIGLFGYNPSDGSFMGTRYVGFSNTFEIADIEGTRDGGLIICGTTYLAGRFPRICIFKLPEKVLAESFR